MVGWVKKLLALHVSRGQKWLYALSQGFLGLLGLLVSLLLLAQFSQFTLLKLVVWLLPLGGWGVTVVLLWRNEQWNYRQGILLPRFVPRCDGKEHLRYSLLTIAYWLLVWLLWPETAWLGTWQFAGSELLMQALSTIKAPPGYYQLDTGEWLGLQSTRSED